MEKLTNVEQLKNLEKGDMIYFHQHNNRERDESNIDFGIEFVSFEEKYGEKVLICIRKIHENEPYEIQERHWDGSLNTFKNVWIRQWHMSIERANKNLNKIRKMYATP